MAVLALGAIVVTVVVATSRVTEPVGAPGSSPARIAVPVDAPQEAAVVVPAPVDAAPVDVARADAAAPPDAAKPRPRARGSDYDPHANP